MDFLSEFTLTEMLEMESIYKEIGEESLAPEVCQGLATSFSYAPNGAGKPPVTREQVQSWFRDRLKSQPKFASSSMALNLFDLTNASNPSEAPESSKKSKGKSAADISDLTFEARSLKDNAWYDVASFLNYRVLSTGELEVRVRYSGFRNTDDEWVNVKRAVRERSIPLEPSECYRLKVGDLVLCFQERQQHAVYCDAHVVDIQRRLHDVRGCRCIFLVRYDDDKTEEEVRLDRICCRPA